jgi:hypothetical protein
MQAIPRLRLTLKMVKKTAADSQNRLTDVLLQRDELKAALLHATAPSSTPGSSGDDAFRAVIESLVSTLTCPLCYEPLTKNAVVTLRCGHTLCQPCLFKWEVRSTRLRQERSSYWNINEDHAECPECRADVRGKVKVYMLEEIVRVLGRLMSPAADELMEDEAEAEKYVFRICGENGL